MLYLLKLLDGFQLGHFNKEICCSYFCCLHFQPVLFCITKDITYTYHHLTKCNLQCCDGFGKDLLRALTCSVSTTGTQKF